MPVVQTLLTALLLLEAYAAGPLCLFCNDVISPRTCTTVRQCGHYDKCYMETTVNTMGRLRYNLGCKDSNMCPTQSSRRRSSGISICYECCNGDMCNTAGCGFSGFPPKETRGPMCLTCRYQRDVNSCGTFTQCGRGEMCKLNETLTPLGEKFYHSGCEPRDLCLSEFQSHSILSYVGRRRRAVDVAIQTGSTCKIKCCENDFCNRNCDSGPINANVTIDPNPTRTTGPTTPKVFSNGCVERWSPWINKHGPSGGVEREGLTEVERQAFCPLGKVTDIECTTAHGDHAVNPGEVVFCSVDTGLVCDSNPNHPVPCRDYEVRYFCNCVV